MPNSVGLGMSRRLMRKTFGVLVLGLILAALTAPGFTATSLANVLVELNKTITANLTLQVGAVTTTVEVSEAAAAIDTTTAQVQSNYDARMAQELPMSSVDVPGRNQGALNLSLLSAGVASSGGRSE